MSTALTTLENRGDLLWLTLRRPPLNFLNLRLLQEIQGHLDSREEPSTHRALVLDAEGAAFCAGLEVAELTREGVFLLIEQHHKVALALLGYPRPTIAVVRGMALGAGNELAACCDWVLASDKASFGQPEIKMGSIPSLAPLLLPALVGYRRSLEMILTGTLLGAKDAERIGLIHRAMPDDQLEAAARELARTFGGFSLPVLEVAIQSVREGRLHELETHLRKGESLFLNTLMELEDPAEGVRAFLEKRSPNWRHQ